MNALWILLLLAVIAAGVAFWMRRAAPDPRRSAPAMPEDDLRSLGLTAARPRSEDALAASPAFEARPVRSSHAPVPESVAPGSVIRDRAAWGTHADALSPLLDAFAATLGGPVALLTTADGVASVDALAEADGAPRLPQRRLSAERTRALADGATDVLELSAAAEDALRAFRAATADMPPDAAARRLGTSRLLVIGGELSDATLDIADRYADLLAALADDAASHVEEPAQPEGSDDESRSTPSVSLHADREESALELVDLSSPDADRGRDAAPEPDALDLDGASEPHMEERTEPVEPSHARPGLRSVTPTAPVPRAVLLAAEIASARAAGRPLAFALITRTDAEAALADGGADAATVALCTEVELADEVRRAEPFGDLVVGAFLDADADAARAWADGLEVGAFRVGLVAPADYDAESLRADAEEALRRAWVEDRGFVLATP